MISADRFFSVSSRLLHVFVAALAVCFGVIIMCGCDGGRGKATDAALASAEELMEERPDSAFAVLCTIDSTAIDNAGRRALHGLLMSEARYKNFIDETDDSIIAASAAYFGRKGDDRRLMRSRFIQAKIQFNNSDYTHSIVSALKAEKLAKQDSDNLYLARIYDHIADIHNATYNVSEELRYAQMVVDRYKLTDKKENYLFALHDLARAKWNCGDAKGSLQQLDSLIKLTNPTDTGLMSNIYVTCIKAAIECGQLDKAELAADNLEKIHWKYSEDEKWIMLCSLYLAKNDYTKVAEILDSLDCSANTLLTEAKLQSFKAQYNELMGDYKLSNEFYKDFVKTSTSIVDSSLNQSVIKAQRDYYSENARSSQRKAEKMHFWIIIIFILLIVITIGWYILYRLRISRADKKLSEFMGLYQAMSEEIREREISLEKLKQEVSQSKDQIIKLTDDVNNRQLKIEYFETKAGMLYRQQFAILNKLCWEYYTKNESSDKVKLSIYKEVESQILKLRDESNFQQIEASLNEYFDDVMVKFRQSFPGMKRVDMHFVILFFAGFSTKAICIICNQTLGNCYNKRQRLKNKIELSGSEYKSQFLEFFS